MAIFWYELPGWGSPVGFTEYTTGLDNLPYHVLTRLDSSKSTVLLQSTITYLHLRKRIHLPAKVQEATEVTYESS